jgi:hypothetical protein
MPIFSTDRQETQTQLAHMRRWVTLAIGTY